MVTALAGDTSSYEFPELVLCPAPSLEEEGSGDTRPSSSSEGAGHVVEGLCTCG